MISNTKRKKILLESPNLYLVSQQVCSTSGLTFQVKRVRASNKLQFRICPCIQDRFSTTFAMDNTYSQTSHIRKRWKLDFFENSNTPDMPIGKEKRLYRPGYNRFIRKLGMFLRDRFRYTDMKYRENAMSLGSHFLCYLFQ